MHMQSCYFSECRPHRRYELECNLLSVQPQHSSTSMEMSFLHLLSDLNWDANKLLIACYSACVYVCFQLSVLGKSWRSCAGSEVLWSWVYPPDSPAWLCSLTGSERWCTAPSRGQTAVSAGQSRNHGNSDPMMHYRCIYYLVLSKLISQ